METVHVQLEALKDLNVQLYKDMQALAKSSYAIFIVFKKQASSARLLQDETVTADAVTTDAATTDVSANTDTIAAETLATTVTASNTTNTTNATLRIQPYVMTGYLFTLLALFVVLVGAIALCSVQSPDKFPRLPLLVGRESN